MCFLCSFLRVAVGVLSINPVCAHFASFLTLYMHFFTYQRERTITGMNEF